MSNNFDLSKRPEPDALLQDIAHYVHDGDVSDKLARDTAIYCLMDTLGCGFLALAFPECTKHLGPIVPNTLVPNGARVPGTPYVMDPIKAAWDNRCYPKMA